ncbi:hypothetical protein NSZ01_08570 [Nocardioides szechwanensis]|uniref:Uncharacterized protein n=1 Tax=Nocardioides szechwanensis TaxID=1005944 RepID=A0A1G9UZD4_9ACTN|nr:hypothetical protein [Nocardioides szechwanensis]GEP33089.1 hypothetical protein NSZ01_08570 [Nocardioides szechwanensis]SDM65258.1 hypothetical protein SAMN05192576_0601 [Nocardioides szechwanensis]
MSDGDDATPTLRVADVDKMTDAIRGRIDLFGKALAALATLGTGGVGLTKAADLAGWDHGEEKWVLAAVACLVAAAVGALIVAVRLMGVNEPVVLTASLDEEQLGKAKTDVNVIFGEAAQKFGFSTLLALDEHAMSLRRVAARATSEDQRARTAARTNEVQGEIDRALARARLVVVRRNATRVVSDRRAWLCYLTVILGLMGFALSADYVTSEPQSSLELVKTCGEARSAGPLPSSVTSDCPSPSAESAPPSPTAGSRERRAALIEELTALLTTCEEAVADEMLQEADCDAIAGLVRELLSPGAVE